MFSLYAQNKVRLQYLFLLRLFGLVFLWSISKCFVFNCQVTLPIEGHFSRKPMEYVMPTISRHTQVFICIHINQFLSRFQSRYSKIISAHQCLCMLIGRGAEECKLVLFTSLGYTVYITISNVSYSTSTLRFVKSNFSSNQYTVTFSK